MKYNYNNLNLKFIIAICLLLCAAQLAIAAEPELKVAVNKNPVAPGDKFELTYTYGSIPSKFNGPDLKDFLVHSGPIDQIQTNFTNSGVTQSIVFSYLLSAKIEGTFRIGSASIEINNKKVSSKHIDITVNKSAANQNKNQDPDLKGQVFMEAQVSKTNVYPGEPVVVSYKLFTKVDLTRYNIEALPTFTGFWSEEAKLSPQPEFKKESRDGELFHVAEIKKFILFPQQTGELIIPSMQAEIGVRVKVQRDQSRFKNPLDQFFNDPFSNDPFFSDPFFTGYKEVVHKSATGIRKIQVKPLPKPQPDTYNGAVGNFKMDVNTDRTSLKANEAVNLKIKIKGEGNIRLIELRSPVLPANIETYEPKVIESIQIGNSNLSGEKTFEYLLIPRVNGKFKIPEYKLSFFDPASGTFKELSSVGFELNVSPAEPGSGGGFSSNKIDVDKLNDDIIFIKTDPSLLNDGSISMLNNIWFRIGLITPAILFLLFLGYHRKNSKMNIDQVAAKQSKARAKAIKKLKLASVCIKSSEKEKFWEYLAEGMWDYCSDKFNIPISKLNLEIVIEKLQKRACTEETIEQFKTLINKIAMARYSAAGTEEELSVAYENAVNCLTKIEEELI